MSKAFKRAAVSVALGIAGSVFADPFGAPPDDRHAWGVHDDYRPGVKKITADGVRPPSDAIVLGERSNQAFMSLPVRTASLFIHNSVPQSLVDELLRRDPGVKLYGLFDSQHAYCLQNMSKCADRYTLKLVKTFKMPSFADGRPADVHLCRIVAVKKAVSP